MNIGLKIQELRKKQGLNQSKLAEKIDVSRQAVSKWELGETVPDTENVLKLCELFSVTPNEFFDIETKPAEQPIPQIVLSKKSHKLNNLHYGIIFLVLGVLIIGTLVTLSQIIPSQKKYYIEVNPANIELVYPDIASEEEGKWVYETEKVSGYYETTSFIPFLNTYYLHWVFAGGCVLIILSIDRFVKYKKRRGEPACSPAGGDSK